MKLKKLSPRIQPLHKSSSGWASEARQSSAARGYDWAWNKRRLRILARDAGLCQPCLRRGHITPDCRTVDHIVNKARGGSDHDSNLQTICDGPGSCHSAKTAAESRGLVWDEAMPDR
ncbi:MAG: HNH endonuclease [Roseateles sp.]|uniref:HNH endonuclease n=1 Tax=Roseateles sp. TaxID=1971397 RepID=UPI004035A5D5